MKYALITVYHPDGAVVENVSAIARQVDGVFICDNSSGSNQMLFSSVLAEGNGQYIWFGGNLGLSRAFNRVLRDDRYPWREEDYILFFDQDSRVEEGHISALTGQYEAVKSAGYPIGCLGPVYFNTSSGSVEMPKSRRTVAEKVYSVSTIITSSMLTTYGNLEKVGFWNDGVFLDMGDWDLCWRLTAAGMLCCLTDAAVLHHSVGRGEKKIGPLRLRVGAPFREYYQIRDCLYLLGKPYTPMKYRIRFCAMVLVRSPLHVLFLDNRKLRMKYICMGLRDYRRKKTGALEEKETSVV